MLLSNLKIDYTSVRRIANAKLSEQTPETSSSTTTTTTTNTMSTSTSLQDISSHHAQKFSWNNNNSNNNNNNNNNSDNSKDNKDPRIVNFYERLLSSNSGRQLNSSRSDELIFEHPEVTIKPSALDNVIQKRLLTIKPSTTSENLVERDTGKSIPNVLEHPDMRSPVVMQSSQISSSSSSSALFINNNCKTINRTQSVDICVNSARTPSPNIHVEVVSDNAENTNRSSSPNSFAGDSFQSLEHEQNEDPCSSSSSSSIITDSIRRYSESNSKSDVNFIETEEKNF